MRQITEQTISALAPNAAAAANGKKISQKGGFVKLEQSADDTFFLGECTGSGKSNYITTADFIDSAQPVFRCTCPSRQFPCKHSLGLLYEMMSGKSFSVCEIPEDILQKRDKKQARAEKAETAAKDAAEGKPAEPPKVNKAARTKKLQKQLEGLTLTAKLVSDLLTTGLGAMGGTALATYRQLSKQLGDYYLPGPQKLLNKLIIEIEAFQKDGQDIHYEESVQTLMRLNALVKKSSRYLSDKLESGDVAQDDNLLYEELGGAWKLSELAAIGLSKENAVLSQLSFWVEFNDASNEYIDTGCWIDIDTGEIGVKQNFRPLKAIKYIKQDDTVFEVAQVPLLCYYPGEGNRRIRWEGVEFRALTSEDFTKLRGFASPLAPNIKQAKNILKNTLADPYYYALIGFSRIGKTNDGMVLEDTAGEKILLGDAPGTESTVMRLGMLPDTSVLENQVMLGAFFYDTISHHLLLKPLSIITPNQVVRLLY